MKDSQDRGIDMKIDVVQITGVDTEIEVEEIGE